LAVRNTDATDPQAGGASTDPRTRMNLNAPQAR